MGTLAQFVKRKRDRENGTYNESTKNVLRVTTKELELLRSSTTRTAKRKLRKWLRLLEDGNAIEISPPEEVEDEEEDNDEQNRENSDNIHSSNPREAYEALLKSLAKTQGGDVAEAYKRRKKEMEGRSESESESESESDEDDVSDVLYGKQKNENDNNDQQVSKRVMEQIQENDVHKFERPKSPSSEKNLETMVENGKHDKKDGDDGIRIEKNPNIDNILHETSKDALDALDHFEHHLEMTLTEDDVSSLAFLREKSNPFKTMVPKEHHLQAWLPNAALQSSEKATLPNISSNNLANYGVRSRLVSFWREVHEKDRSLGEDERIRPLDRYGDFSSKKQQALFAILNSYCDVLYPVKKYPLKYGKGSISMNHKTL